MFDRLINSKEEECDLCGRDICIGEGIHLRELDDTIICDDCYYEDRDEDNYWWTDI
jgi:hypothetical protein